MRFIDRVEAGKILAMKLKEYRKDSVVYALPRGGVVVGAEIAQSLRVSLDLILVHKIGHPYYPEYAVGAIAEDGPPVFNKVEKQSLPENWLDMEVSIAKNEIERRHQKYFAPNYKRLEARDKIAIIVDDGIATGLTIEAAIKSLRKHAPRKIVVAAPVAANYTIEKLKPQVTNIVVIDSESFLGSVKSHYEHFPRVNDEEVIELLVDT